MSKAIPKLKENDLIEILWHDAHDAGCMDKQWMVREEVGGKKFDYECLSVGYLLRTDQDMIYIAGDIPSGKFQAGAIAGADIADGTITRAKIDAYTAGNYFLIGSDSEKTTAATSYTKVKEIVVTRTGTLRVSFALASVGGFNVYGRVYRNGVAVGTARNTTSTIPQTYSEDISGWGPNDLCQIYAYTEGVYRAKVTNFRLYTGAPERECVTLD